MSWTKVPVTPSTISSTASSVASSGGWYFASWYFASWHNAGWCFGGGGGGSAGAVILPSNTWTIVGRS